MKKSLFILAAAALTLASCSSDETTAVNDSVAKSNEISFRPLLAGTTRATDQTESTLQASGKGFYVTAYHNDGATPSPTITKYFDNVQFKYTTSTYNSDKKYYWPSTGTLDFYAYAPAADNTQLTRTDYKTFTVTPSTTVASQVDLIYANTDGKSKSGAYTPVGGSASTYGAAGVPLNFRHAGCKVVVKVKNSASNDLTFEITGMKIVNVDGSATFTYSDTQSTGDENTDTKDSKQLLVGDWTNNSDAQTVTYSTTMTKNTVNATQATGIFLNGSGTIGTEDENMNMILIPQTTPDVGTTYSSASANAKYTGSYIALKMVIKSTGSSVVIADASQDVSSDNKWAMWPVKFTWSPGKKYTYTIDLANGGYWELNDDTDNNLDPILGGAEIKFVSVTVDDWNAANTIVANAVAGGTYTNNEAAAAAGTYSVTVSGLTSGSSLALGATTSNSLSSLKIYNSAGSEVSTTPSNGVVTIIGTLAANSTASAVTSTITLNETGTATSTTTINVVQEASGS